jgi:SAM-dependent methyltransferase
MRREDVERRLGDYLWYHVIEVAPGLCTPGMEAYVAGQQKVLRAMRRLDFKGKTVLDVGCRDGLYSLEAERLGAQRVVGIDNDLSRGAVELLIPWLGSTIEMRQMNLLDLTSAEMGRFDIVLFAGVLYHLRYPFGGLRHVSDVLQEGGTLLLETAIFADANRHALLHCPTGDENPYEPTSVSFFNLKGLRDSLSTFGLRTDYEELEYKRRARFWDRGKRIDRVVMICRKQESLRVPDLVRYWEDVHSLHTRGPGAPRS